MTSEELGSLFRSGADGWLTTGHMMWITRRINSNQSDSFCIFLHGPSLHSIISENNLHSQRINRLIFIINVGKNPDNSVYIGNPSQPGVHWVLAVCYLSSGCVYYCDSLAWDAPANLISTLNPYITYFHCHLTKSCLVKCHLPTAAGTIHSCLDACTNYSLQTCANICGVIVIINAALCAFDHQLFSMLISNTKVDIYLKRPSVYNIYLRRTLIEWFVSGTVNIRHVSIKSCLWLDHTYTGCAKLFTKQNQQPTHLKPVIPVSQEIRIHGSKNDSTTDKGNNNLDAQPAMPLKEKKSLKVNSGAVTTLQTQKASSGKPSYECNICNQSFTTRQAIWKHRQRKHSFAHPTADISSKNSRKCAQCHVSCSSVADLVMHYQSIHGTKMALTKNEFNDESDFAKWKQLQEKSNRCMYVLHRGARITKYSEVRYYYCSRSGFVKSRSIGIRQAKSQGSSKLGGDCPAFIKFVKDTKTGRILSECCLDHNHECLFAHLHLSEDLQMRIAGKLSAGVKISSILDDIRESVTSIDRDSLIVRKDVHNIKHRFNVEAKERHDNDAVSVSLLVNELNQQEYKPVVFYKPQGQKSDVLKEEDILLVLQTQFQRDMLNKFGGKCICIDSTHKTNIYDFLLITVIVLDEYEEGVPVAWLICNREDCDALKLFFEAIREIIGLITTDVFMSDLAPSFYNAWIAVFPRPAKRFYCSWHVDKCWRKNLQRLVKDSKTKIEIYTCLKVLQSELIESKFRKNLQEFASFASQVSPEFGKYFVATFIGGNAYRLWAGCFRAGVGCPNTNMHTEAFHRLLKTVYFERKQNRRLDHLLDTLLQISKNKAFEQLIKCQKGKLCKRSQETLQRHKRSLAIPDSDISRKEKSWIVRSANHNDYYTVQLRSDRCSCKIRCEYCDACVHFYTCTCPDYLLQHYMCKHIHAVHRQRATPKKKSTPESDAMKKNEYFQRVLCKKEKLGMHHETSSGLSTLKTEALQRLTQIADIVKLADSTEQLIMLKKHLDAARAVGRGLKVSTNSALTKRHSFPSNKNFEKQTRLFKTRKATKVSRSASSLQTPGKEKQLQAQAKLSKYSPTFCGFCFTGSERDDYLSCRKCGIYVHRHCDFTFSPETCTEYLCNSCRLT